MNADLRSGLVACFVFVILCFLIAIPLLYGWDAKKNRGFRFGYWGEFNRVKAVLENAPGMSITNTICNADISLEEFGFDLETDDGREISIFFEEADPDRGKSGEALEKALWARIEKRLEVEQK